MAKFPSELWLDSLKEKLNADLRYGQVARNWEGDMIFQVESGAKIRAPIAYYLDLWHGKCRQAYVVNETQPENPAFTLKAPYENYVRLLKGELDPIQAMLTRKISIKGNMAVLMRNVPTVLDFVRCCREVTSDFE